MLKDYFKNIAITFFTVSITLIGLMFIRYEFNNVSLGLEIGECYVRSNPLSGSSCLVGGTVFCTSKFSDLDSCN